MSRAVVMERERKKESRHFYREYSLSTVIGGKVYKVGNKME